MHSPLVSTVGPMPDKLKQRLYPVVLDFFEQFDFHQVNVRHIAEASGVSTGTIYKYFPSKEALILGIIEEKIAEIHALVNFHIQGLESTREKFRKAYWVLLDYYDRNPGVAITFFITVPTRTWMQQESYARLDTHDIMRRIAEDGRLRGEIDPNLTDAQITGVFFMHCQHAVQLWYYRGRQWRLKDALDRFFPIFWKTVSTV